MELRVLQYFLAVTREQSISGAAEALHLSQPTLSRQLKEMEEELGKQLLIRGNRRVTLTEEGMILRKRAEEIMELVHKAESEIALADDAIAGDVTIGAAESESVRFLVQTAKALREPYIHNETTNEEGTVFPLTVAENCIFVLGDNRAVSLDSRSPQIGQIDRREVLGKALCLIIPGTHHGQLLPDYSRIGAVN